MAAVAHHILVLFVALTVEGKCQPKLNCMLKRRLSCTTSESDGCGSCMPHYMERPSGNCEIRMQGDESKFVGPEEIIDLINRVVVSGTKVTRGQRVNQTSTASPTDRTTSEAAASSPSTAAPLLPQRSNKSTVMGPVSLSPPTNLASGLEWRMSSMRKSDFNQTISLALIVICCLTGFSGILVAALCWYRLQQEVRLAQKMAYSAYKGSRQQPCQRSVNDNSHYMWQDQKKQHLAQDGSGMRPQKQFSTDSEEADIEEFTMYECPGLAPVGEMEVHNPLFDPLPATQ
uniref:Neural proliferation differentiation and control protein 1 n=1 Tax=Leptobrachium leishanense TaxID=445787 RepID=A0A8C5QR49_9ANUR